MMSTYEWATKQPASEYSYSENSYDETMTYVNINTHHSYATVYCLFVDEKLDGVYSTEEKAIDYLNRIGFDKKVPKSERTIYYNDVDAFYRYAYIKSYSVG